jgi:hypothetical protein
LREDKRHFFRFALFSNFSFLFIFILFVGRREGEKGGQKREREGEREEAGEERSEKSMLIFLINI